MTTPIPDTTYNGWTNYATWRVNLEIIDGIRWDDDVKDGISYDSVYDFSLDLKERAEEAISNYGDLQSGLALDYALAFLSEVNYYEIAKHIAEDYPQLLKTSK